MTETNKRPAARRSRLLAASLVMLITGAAGPVAQAEPPMAPPDLFDAASEGDFAGLEAALPTLSPDWAQLARARLAAGRLDEDTALSLADAFLGQHEGGRCEAVPAQAIIADAAFASARYARAFAAAKAHREQLQRCHGDTASVEGAAMMQRLAERLAPAPPQRVAAFTPATTPYTRDKAGLPRSYVSINGHLQEAVLDTGANLSVVSASTARRLGLHPLGKARVGSSSRAGVAVQVAMADTLHFAGLALENVAFLILDDAQLEMPLPGGYRIDAIVGFPVFRAMQRVRFDHAGTLVPEPGAGSSTRGRNLLLAGSDLFVDVRVGGIAAQLHLDSGGNNSSLAPPFATRHPEILQGLATSRQRLAGAGGATEREIALWPQARMEVDDHSIILPALPVALGASGDARARGQGVLGNDVLNAFDHWTLDLEHMRLELGTPLECSEAPCPSTEQHT